MDQETHQEEIKPLIFNYVFHFILFILLLILHIVMYIKIYWIYNSLSILFQIGTYINIIYFLFAIFPFIILIKKIYKKKILSSIKLVTFILLMITIMFGLMISIAMIINSLESKTFCRECPFNLNIAHLNSALSSFYGKTVNDDDIKDRCNSRRCILDSENIDEDFPDTYLCNYDPTDEFDNDELYKRQFPNGTEITSNKQIKCLTVSPNYSAYNYQHIELYYYLDLCYYYSDFYRCSRFNKPEKYYNIDLNGLCPETNYLVLIYVLCVLIIIMDLIISLLPWGVEFMSLKRIVNILSVTRRKVNSNNSTEKSSEISQNEESFKKEKTPVIILPLEENNNDLKKESDNILVIQLDKNKPKLNNIHLDDIKDNNKINQINLHDIKETDKEYTKPNNIKLFNSERNNLKDKNIEIDLYSNYENSNLFPTNRNILNKKNEQSTTLNTNIKPLEIRINNDISNKK